MNWFKRAIFHISIALSKVEKNALGQIGNNLSDDTNAVQRHMQGTLADDLLQGRLTEEVTLLRARLYKVIEATQELRNNIKPILNENGEIINYDISVKSSKKPLYRKIKGDPFDDYKVLMEINNRPITASVLESLERIGNYGIINEFSIIINREIHPRLEIEKYTKKLLIRKISESKRLLEFYIPKYYDEYDKKTVFLISSIRKAQSAPKNSDLLDIKSVGFVTNGDAGVKDFLEFQYMITEFDKIVEYDGNYIIKFFATPMVEGENIFEKYRSHKLDEKYKNKEFKGKL